MVNFPEQFKNYAWVMLSLAFLTSFLLHLLLFGTAPMVNEIMSEMSLSHANFGLIFSISMVSLIVFRIPWGFMIDRYGYLKILKVSLPLISASAIIRSFSPNYWILLLSQFGLGLGLASILPCLPPLVKEWLPSRTGFGTGFYVSGFAVGNGAALGLTPFLLHSFEWRIVLLVYGIIALATTLLWWVFGQSSVEETSEYDFKNFQRILKDRYVWVLTFFMIACMGGYDTLATWIPKVLEMKYFEEAAAFFLPLGFLVSGPLVGFLSDKLGSETNSIAALGVLASVSVFGLVFASGFVLIPLLFSSGFFLTGILTLTLEAPARHGRLSSSAGTASSLISSLGNVGPAVVPVAFGYLIDVTGTYEPSLILVGLIVVSTFLIGSIFWE